jgi:undecaprenyl-diphosphatase
VSHPEAEAGAGAHAAPPPLPDRLSPSETSSRPWDWRTPLALSVAAFVAACLVGIAYAVLLRSSGDWATGLPWELALMSHIDHDAPRAIDLLMLALPWLGTNLTIMPVLCAVALWLARSRRRLDLAARLIVVTTGSLLLNAVLKALFGRPRPELWAHRGQYAWASIPSGHAIVTTSVLFTAALMLHRERGWRWPFAVAAVILVVSLYSRLYLGEHWPSDVIAGILIGVTWLLGTMYAFRRSERVRGA